ncbi:MAG TPA: hypothetical protein PKY59_25415 [Pyrinomonadaceae bacterium]|nr:hypothetical protein [Pyrinomonadaceae bacterium]
MAIFSVTEPLKGVCEACGSKTDLVENICFLCDRVRTKQRKVRIGGAVLTIIGVIVSVAMATVIVFAMQAIAQSRKMPNPHFPQSSVSTDNAMLAILFAFLGYGIAALIAGGWHWITGEVNKRLIFIMSGAGIFMFFAARLFVIVK